MLAAWACASSCIDLASRELTVGVSVCAWSRRLYQVSAWKFFFYFLSYSRSTVLPISKVLVLVPVLGWGTSRGKKTEFGIEAPQSLGSYSLPYFPASIAHL